MSEPTNEDLMSDIYSGIGHRAQHDDFAPARIAAERLQARLEAAEAELAEVKPRLEAAEASLETAEKGWSKTTNRLNWAMNDWEADQRRLKVAEAELAKRDEGAEAWAARLPSGFIPIGFLRGTRGAIEELCKEMPGSHPVRVRITPINTEDK